MKITQNLSRPGLESRRSQNSNFNNFPDILPLVPILPFVFAYGLEGGGAAGERLFSSRRTGCVIMLLAGLAIYGVSHGLATSPELDGRIEIEAAETQGLFSFIRKETPEDSLIVSLKPRALALFTGRRSTLRTATSSLEDDLEDFLQRGVDYAVVITGEPSPFFNATEPIWFADPSWRHAFELEYSSAHFELLRFIPDRAQEVVAARRTGNGIDGRR